MGTLPPALTTGPVPDHADKPWVGIKIKLLLWLLAGPVLAALVGVVALQVREAQWSRALASAARMNGVPAPAGPSLTAICADPVLALPSCIDLTVFKALFITASVSGVLGLALFGVLLDVRRRAAGGRSRLLRAFRPALSITIGAACVLLVLNAALAVMSIYVLPFARTDWSLWLLGAFVVMAMVSGLVRLGRVVLGLRHAPVNEVMGRRLRPSESPSLRTLVTEVARRVGTAPPRHLIVGLMPNFFATQSPVTCAGETLSGRTLFISLPLCRVLSVDELASVIGHELGHFRGRDTEFSESITPIYRGAIDTLIALIHGMTYGGWQSFLLRPALYAFAVFLDGFEEAEATLRREREHAADQAAVTASNADAAAAALVKVHAFSPAWDDVDEEARRLCEAGERVDNFSTFFAERAAVRSAGDDPLANLLDEHLAHPSDSHPPLGARLAHIGVPLEGTRDRALNVAPEDAASGLVDNLESIERGQSASLQDVYITLLGGTGAEGGWWRTRGRWLALGWAGVVAWLAFAFGIAWLGEKYFPRPWFPPTPAVGKTLAPLPVMPKVPDRAALLDLLRDRQYDALERELADAVRRSREIPRDEIIATTAFRTFWIADPSITALLDEWVKRDRDSPLARLARARHASALAGAARGTKWARETSAAQFAAMRQHHANARRDLKEALTRDPSLVEAHAELILLARHARTDECEASGTPALRVAPASFRLRALILECLEPRWGGSFERMRAFALVSQRYASENPRLPALIGHVEKELGRTLALDDREAEAIGAYTVALSHGPDGIFYDLRAASYRAMGDHVRALPDADAALTLIPQDPELLADRARSLDKLGRSAEASEAIALAARVDPSNQDVQRLSRYFSQRDVVGGHALAKEGMTAGASLAFDAAIQADPTNVQAFYWRGRAHLKSGDMARALEDFKRALEIDPTHFESCRNIDYLLAREQRWDDIIAMWTEYLVRKPDDGAAYLERAGAERRNGDMTQAIADVRRACELGNAQACRIARSLPAESSTSS